MRQLSRLLLILPLVVYSSLQTAAAPSGDPPSPQDQLEALTAKATEEVRAERHEDALKTLQELLDLALTQDETELAMNVSAQMATTCSKLGDGVAAIEHFRRAATLARQVGNLSGVAAAMNAVGFEASLLGRRQDAIDAYEEGLRVALEIQDPSNEEGARRGLALLEQMEAQ